MNVRYILTVLAEIDEILAYVGELNPIPATTFREGCTICRT